MRLSDVIALPKKVETKRFAGTPPPWANTPLLYLSPLVGLSGSPTKSKIPRQFSVGVQGRKQIDVNSHSCHIHEATARDIRYE